MKNESIVISLFILLRFEWKPIRLEISYTNLSNKM